MNPKPTSETDSLRSDIEMTRRRMDDTMDALGDRLRGRHLLDEIVGFFRGNENDDTESTGERLNEKMSEVGQKVSQAASTAATAVVDTVKKNPVPILLIGAGAAWLAYSMTRKKEETGEIEDNDLSDYDPDTHYDRPLEYPGGSAGKLGDESTSKLGEIKDTLQEKAGEATDQIKDRLSDLGERASEKFQSVKERASELGGKVQDQTRRIYTKTRDQVVRTTNEHPLEVGLGFLAVGLIAGLALPTPAPVHRIAGPTMDRLKNRTRNAGQDILEKGKRVARAAADAAKQEAQSQGLTLNSMRSGNRGDGQPAPAQDEPRAGTEPADPSAARPVM
jgi:ElaB/YqjD/DUF883 family membrane-anchored ribosome-binding protein